MIYLDNNASTRVDPSVVTEIVPLLTEWYANPSSAHSFGAHAGGLIEQARESVAALIGARPDEIIFTSGGTEADNAAIHGLLGANPGKRHVVVSAVEHHAVIEQCEALEQQGVEVTFAPVHRDGTLDLEALGQAVRSDTALVGVMLANNETGVIMPLAEIIEIARQHGVPVFSDAVNALGKMPLDLRALPLDVVALSSHKIHGPKGVGALFVRKGTPFSPLIIGGPQEQRRRGGTLNAPGIVGFGTACRLLTDGGPAAGLKVKALRDRFESEVVRRIPSANVVGAAAARTPNTSCVCFEGAGAEAVLMLLSEAGVCVSSGAACSSGAIEPSRVMQAMKVPTEQARGQIRFSFGRFNTDEEVDHVVALLPQLIEKAATLAVS